MSRRNWKNTQPHDLRDAMDLCVDYAREKHNRSVDSIADLMGVPSKHTLYKWIADANMPAIRIKSFEHACGIDFVSRWFVISSGKLVIDVPKGRKGTPEDIQVLQAAAHAAIGELMKFYEQKTDVPAVLVAIQNVLENFAWHKGNVEKFQQPEIPFDEE